MHDVSVSEWLVNRLRLSLVTVLLSCALVTWIVAFVYGELKRGGGHQHSDLSIIKYGVQSVSFWVGRDGENIWLLVGCETTSLAIAAAASVQRIRWPGT